MEDETCRPSHRTRALIFDSVDGLRAQIDVAQHRVSELALKVEPEAGGEGPAKISERGAASRKIVLFFSTLPTIAPAFK
jgi:hypothetical protein